MSWSRVGDWIKDNAGTGAALVGSLLTGNAPAAVAAGVALVSSATGTADPVEALEQLQRDPGALVRLRELSYENERSIREHLEGMARIDLEHHEATQRTIQSGDNSQDEYVRMTRPQMARQSWRATVAYCLGAFVYEALTGEALFNMAIAGVLSAPAWAYLGLRTGDKFAQAWSEGKKWKPK